MSVNITEAQLFALPKHELVELQKKISHVRVRKYESRRHRKYTVPGYKAFGLEDIDFFFSAFRPEEYRSKVMFLVQAFLGLRIGEVVKVRLQDLDFERKSILIHTEKKKHNPIDFMAMHEKVESLLLDYVAIYQEDIQKHGGYLFFSSASQSRGYRFPYISVDRARNVFRKVCDRAGFNECYAERESTPGLQPKPGKMHRYSTHSLRFSFGAFLAKRGVPIELAKHMLRHSDLKSTQIYYVPQKEDIDAKMRELFVKN